MSAGMFGRLYARICGSACREVDDCGLVVGDDADVKLWERLTEARPPQDSGLRQLLAMCFYRNFMSLWLICSFFCLYVILPCR